MQEPQTASFRPEFLCVQSARGCQSLCPFAVSPPRFPCARVSGGRPFRIGKELLFLPAHDRTFDSLLFKLL